jgi:diguanylate cyclase (GGDEF)-like protein
MAMLTAVAEVTMAPVAVRVVAWLVAVSVFTSMVASYAAFIFAERITTSRGGARVLWLVSGAMAMGLGIWSMHYLGMLAVRLPVEVFYHLPTVLLSLLLAVLASVVALLLVSRAQLTARLTAAGSVLMGGGIGAMHYTGMHAMRSSVMHQYNPIVVLVSVAVAVAFSWMALWITFAMRTHELQREWGRVGGAALMGLGIAAMHYTAMAAVHFVPCATPYSTRYAVHINTIGVAGVVFTTGTVLMGALITALVDRRRYEEIASERERLHAAAECSMDCLYLCDAVRNPEGEIVDFEFTYVNSNVVRAVGRPLEEMLGGRMCELLPMIRNMGHFELYRQVVATGQPLAMEFSVPDHTLADGQPATTWVRIQAVKLHDGLAITASDITQRKVDEERIRHLAHHDPLTGLINRSLLGDRIDQAIQRATRSGGLVGVFLVDLDGFKQINDTLGHSAGDSVLITVAGRLRGVVRAVDSVIRIGGDEFVVVLPEIGRHSDIGGCARRILDAFQHCIPVDSQCLGVHCSIGVAVYPDAGLTSGELLSKADAAMYNAKRRGKNQFDIYGEGAELEEELANEG